MRYRTYADYFREKFGSRIQKLSIDGGFTCPNRDGKVGTGGCTFCRNDAFNPSYCRRVDSIAAQLDEGIAFHRHRYRNAPKYLAYFQAYSNTYAPVEVLRERYMQALEREDVAGIVIGTRPDDIVNETTLLNALPLTSVKFHQLQILKDTEMERQYSNENFRASLLQLTLEEYVALVCDMLERLRPDMVVERVAGEVPPRYQACPERSFRRADGRLMRNEELPTLVDAELQRRGSQQGSRYKKQTP